MKANPKPFGVEGCTIRYFPSVADISLRFSATVFDELTKQYTDEYINNEFGYVFRVPVSGVARIDKTVVSVDNKNYTLKVIHHKPKC